MDTSNIIEQIKSDALENIPEFIDKYLFYQEDFDLLYWNHDLVAYVIILMIDNNNIQVISNIINTVIHQDYCLDSTYNSIYDNYFLDIFKKCIRLKDSVLIDLMRNFYYGKLPDFVFENDFNDSSYINCWINSILLHKNK